MMHSMIDLTGRTALVTGGGGHLGGASSLALAEAGADVIIVDINREAAETMVERVRRAGRKSLAITGDVSKYNEVSRMASEALEAFGHIDILVNIAGKSEPREFLDLTAADFDAVM